MGQKKLNGTFTLLWLVPYALSLKSQENGNHFPWRNVLRNLQTISQLAMVAYRGIVLRQGVGGHKDMLPTQPGFYFIWACSGMV